MSAGQMAEENCVDWTVSWVVSHLALLSNTMEIYQSVKNTKHDIDKTMVNPFFSPCTLSMRPSLCYDVYLLVVRLASAYF
jgi:hypothetical protein